MTDLAEFCDPTGGRSTKSAVRVTYYHRKPTKDVTFGIEEIFEAVRARLPKDIESTVAVAPFMSVGLLRRMFNVVEAVFRQGDVNHITGDIHYVAFLLRKRKTILTVHDCGFENHPNRTRRKLLRLFWLTIPEKRVAVIATDSEFSRGRILDHSGCPCEKVIVIPACISPTFRRIDKSFDADRPTILQVGTSPNKNLERVCAALQGVRCRLRVLGKLSTEQRATLDRAGVVWRNDVGLTTEEVLMAYGESDIVVFASTYEGFGLPILEANTVGRPVVTSNLASMPEVAGGAAFLVDPFDPRSIRHGVDRVRGDAELRAELVRRGFENAARFSPAATAAGYVDIYRSLARSGPRDGKRLRRAKVSHVVQVARPSVRRAREGSDG